MRCNDSDGSYQMSANSYDYYHDVSERGYPTDEELGIGRRMHPLRDLTPDLEAALGGVHRFCEFAEMSKNLLHGDVVPMRKVVGYPIIVTSYKVLESHFYKTQAVNQSVDENEEDEEEEKKPHTYVKIQFTYIKDPRQIVRVVNSSSGVLQRQLEEYKDQIPFATVINTRRNYLTFT